MGGACSTYEGEKRCIQGFGRGTEGKRHPDVDGRVILRMNFRKWDGSIYWIDMV